MYNNGRSPRSFETSNFILTTQQSLQGKNGLYNEKEKDIVAFFNSLFSFGG